MSLTTRVGEDAIKQKLILSDRDSQRNSPSFISCLPTEIMQSIFVYCARDYYIRLIYRYASYPLVPDWVNVSYVCRHWRNMALNCPEFWSYHFMVSRRWTEELLARSKQASLKIHLDMSDEPWQLDIVEKLMNRVECIEELRVDLWVGYTREAFSKFSSPAPHLQNLQIFGSTPERPPVLFCGDTPALRTLWLETCQVSWYSLKLGSLTTLRLRSIPAACQLNMENFLTTLSCMQGLTFLGLDDALGYDADFLSSTVFHNFHKIDLPCLSRLSIAEPLSTVVALLSCVNVPLKAEVRLYCDFELYPPFSHYALLSAVLAERFTTSEDQTPSSSGSMTRSVIMELETSREGGELELRTWECDCDPLSRIEWRESCENRFHFAITVQFNPAMMTSLGDRLIGDISCSLPRTHVQSILFANPLFSSAFWRRMLGHFQNLRHMKLSRGYMPDLSVLSHADLFTHSSEDTGSQGGYAPSSLGRDYMLVPALEMLELDQMTFSPGDDSDLPKPAITHGHLLDVLSTRTGSQGRLHVTECRIGKSDMLDMVQPWGDTDVQTVGE